MRHITGLRRLIIPLATLAALGACAVDDGGLAEEEAIPDGEAAVLATVVRDNGNEVRFYEPVPGEIYMTEVGTGSLLPQGDDVLELYRAAARDDAAPDRLVAASSRAAQRTAEGAADRAGPAAVELSVPPEQAVDAVASEARAPAAALANPCSINTFIANECKDGDMEWCKINWHNGFYAYSPQVDWFWQSVCAVQGNVTMATQINSVPQPSITVGQGSIGRVSRITPFINFGFHTQVTNASGDTFHVGGAATNL
jgi:hypothetical protein